MSKNDVIARLEALLARVRTRAGDARATGAQGSVPRAVAPTAVAARVAPVAPAAPPVRPVVAPLVAPPPSFAATEPSMPALVFAPATTEPSMPAVFAPAPPAAAPPLTAPRPLPLDEEASFARPKRPQVTEPDIVVDVDVQETTLDTVIGVPSEEPVVPESAESRERLVAAEPAALDATAELSTAPDAVPFESLPPGDLEEPAAEEAPASSRRPMAPAPEQRLADMAFGNEELPPRHTPPPESGRLPAAPVVEFDGDVTGVRDAQSIPHAAARAAPLTTELEPEVTRPALAPSEEVADVLGEAQRLSPATFVALLEASLAL